MARKSITLTFTEEHYDGYLGGVATPSYQEILDFLGEFDSIPVGWQGDWSVFPQYDGSVKHIPSGAGADLKYIKIGNIKQFMPTAPFNNLIAVSNDFTNPNSQYLQIVDVDDHMVVLDYSREFETEELDNFEITLFGEEEEDDDDTSWDDISEAAVPSIERSLDKIVDKMTGATVVVTEETDNSSAVYDFIQYTPAGLIFSNFDLDSYKPGDTGTIEFLLNGEVTNIRTVEANVYNFPVMGTVITDGPPEEIEHGDGNNASFVIGTDGRNFMAILDGNVCPLWVDAMYAGQVSQDFSALQIRITMNGGSIIEKEIPAYEAYKEAVPSVERSLYRIAHYFEPNKSSTPDTPVVPEEVIYDTKNVKRYNIITRGYDWSNIIQDELDRSIERRISYEELCEEIKRSPYCVKSLEGFLTVNGYSVGYKKLPVSYAYIDFDDDIHLTLDFQLINGVTSDENYEYVIFGEVIIHNIDGFFKRQFNTNQAWLFVTKRTTNVLSLEPARRYIQDDDYYENY